MNALPVILPRMLGAALLVVGLTAPAPVQDQTFAADEAPGLQFSCGLESDRDDTGGCVLLRGAPLPAWVRFTQPELHRYTVELAQAKREHLLGRAENRVLGEPRPATSRVPAIGHWADCLEASILRVESDSRGRQSLVTWVPAERFLGDLSADLGRRGRGTQQVGSAGLVASFLLGPEVTGGLGVGDYVLRVAYDDRDLTAAGVHTVGQPLTAESRFSVRAPAGEGELREVALRGALYQLRRGQAGLASLKATSILAEEPPPAARLQALTVRWKAREQLGDLAGAIQDLEACLALERGPERASRKQWLKLERLRSQWQAEQQPAESPDQDDT